MTETQRKRFSDALQRVGGDEEMLEMLAKIVSEDGPELIENLTDQVDQGDLNEVARVAHAMKGLFSTFETGDPVCELQTLIDTAKQANVAETKSLYAKVKPKLGELLAEIDAIAQISA